MSRYVPLVSGRKARRSQHFSQRRKGAGWTRPFRKGRKQRFPFQASKQHEEEA